MKQLRIIISGGGTGGHIFPALAIADEIRSQFPDSEILFVGATGKMEMEKVPLAGYKIIGLPVMGFPRKPGLSTLKFFVRLIRSSNQARKIIKTFKPDIAVGVGGFASGPLLRAATRKNIPTLIQEQNSYAGITNKLLSKKVSKICVAYNNMGRFFPAEKIVQTGNPVRGNLLKSLNDVPKAREFFGLKPGDKVLLIVGGSLGARSLNDAVINSLDKIAKSDVQIIWQTGAIYYEEMCRKTEKVKPANLQLHKFLIRMDYAYTASDLVVARAGAGTISELCLLGKPSVLVPSPNVAEDHQTKNALALVEEGAAVLIADNEISQKLFDTAFSLLNDNNRLEALAENSKKLAKPEATKTIVTEIVGLIKK